MVSVPKIGRLHVAAGAERAVSHGVAPMVRPPHVRDASVAYASTVRCSTCRLRGECLPAELQRAEIEAVDGRLSSTRRKVAQGDTLFRAGEAFDAIFAVWTGSLKTIVVTRQGREQVTGFPMAGDLVGFDGIHTGQHGVDAIALEDTQVCVIPYEPLQALAQELPVLQRRLHRLLSREIVSDHGAMLHLGSMYAEERLAAFLLDLAARLEARGYSGSSLLLRMSRAELGSYLGLKLETVSRTFSRFQSHGLLHVSQRQVFITDPEGLGRILDGAEI